MALTNLAIISSTQIKFGEQYLTYRHRSKSLGDVDLPWDVTTLAIGEVPVEAEDIIQLNVHLGLIFWYVTVTAKTVFTKHLIGKNELMVN